MMRIDDPLLIRTADMLRKARYPIAFTGAGVSVESGIPAFRGDGGIWEKYDPKTLYIDYFYASPKEAWEVIREIFYTFMGRCSPNRAHEVLAHMESEGMLKAIITQNIDNLHQQAGSREVVEFHGNSQRLCCTRCSLTRPASELTLETLPPLCECGGIFKPDFVFFGENIPEQAFQASVREVEQCDLLLIVGTSGEVAPASLIPSQARRNGADIIEINPSPSNYTATLTDVFLQGKAGEIFDHLDQLLFSDKKNMNE